MRPIFTFTIAILILTACSQAPITTTPTPLPSITPTRISTVTATVLPTFTPTPSVDPDNRVDVGEGMTESLNDLKVDLGDGVVYQFEFASTEAKQKVKHACDVAGWATWMAARGAENRQYVSFADWWAGVQAHDGKFSGAQELVHYKNHKGRDPKGIGVNLLGMTKPVEGAVDFSTCTLKIAPPLATDNGTTQFNGMFLPGLEFSFKFDEKGNPRVSLGMQGFKAVYDFFYANKDRTPAQNEDAFSAMVATFVEGMNRLENAKSTAFRENNLLVLTGQDPTKDPHEVVFSNLAVSTYEIKKFLETDAPFLKLKK